MGSTVCWTAEISNPNSAIFPREDTKSFCMSMTTRAQDPGSRMRWIRCDSSRCELFSATRFYYKVNPRKVNREGIAAVLMHHGAVWCHRRRRWLCCRAMSLPATPAGVLAETLGSLRVSGDIWVCIGKGGKASLQYRSSKILHRYEYPSKDPALVALGKNTSFAI